MELEYLEYLRMPAGRISGSYPCERALTKSNWTEKLLSRNFQNYINALKAAKEL
jgi:hypothetical protein